MGCSESSCNLTLHEVVNPDTQPHGSVGGQEPDSSAGLIDRCETQDRDQAPVNPEAPHASESDDAPGLAEQDDRAEATLQAPWCDPLGEVPESFEVRLKRRKGDLVGAVLGNSSVGAVIFSVQEGGIFDCWNKKHPELEMRQGFIIDKVNGQKGYWGIMQEMRKVGSLVIRVTSKPPANAAEKWFEEIAAMAKGMEEQKSSSFMLRVQPQDPSDHGAARFANLPCVRAGACGVDQCAICLDDVAPHETLVQLPCKHAFHHICAGRWLAETKSKEGKHKQTCPLCCRKVVGEHRSNTLSIDC